MKDTDKRTIDYYDKNALKYSESVNTADMEQTYQRFLKYVPEGSSVADIGCGSGRDLKYFREAGYKAFGMDASEELCKIAREYSACPVDCTSFLSWNPASVYDAFWANASLLHLKREEIISFFRSKTQFLADDGVLYFSMKSGICEGFDSEGRFFTPFSEDLLSEILKEGKLRIVERWTQSDKLNRTGFSWECVILKKR